MVVSFLCNFLMFLNLQQELLLVEDVKCYCRCLERKSLSQRPKQLEILTKISGDGRYLSSWQGPGKVKWNQSLLRRTKAQTGTHAASKFTHRLSRLLVHVRMGKSCIMLAPRNILKHTRWQIRSLTSKRELVWMKNRLFLSGVVPDSGTYSECRSDRFWKAEAPTKDRGLS